MKKMIYFQDNTTAKTVKTISLVITLIIVILRAFAIKEDALLCVVAGLACYFLIVYVLGSITGCLVVKRNAISFKMRCVLLAMTGIGTAYSVIMSIVSRDLCLPYRVLWGTISLLILLLAVIIAYNGYICEKHEK